MVKTGKRLSRKDAKKRKERKAGFMHNDNIPCSFAGINFALFALFALLGAFA